MPKTSPFDEHAGRYEEWFEKNPLLYEAELRAVRMALPPAGSGVEIGVGSGRFAGPLGIRSGVEPSRSMRELARSRGIDAVDGTAECLPFPDACFDFALFVTTICFLDNVARAFREAGRVLKKGGSLIVGFVEKTSRLGLEYQRRKSKSLFYGDAVFYSREEVVRDLAASGFLDFRYYQTLCGPGAAVADIEPVREGFGQGSFLVIRGVKERSAAWAPIR